MPIGKRRKQLTRHGRRKGRPPKDKRKLLRDSDGQRLYSDDPVVEKRRRQELRMRIDGHTLAEIALKLKVSIATVSGDIQAVLARVRIEANQLAEDARSLDLDRLDTAIKGIMPAVKRGEPRSVERLVQIVARRAKLIGTDVAARAEITGKDGAPLVDVPVDAVLEALQAVQQDTTDVASEAVHDAGSEGG